MINTITELKETYEKEWFHLAEKYLDEFFEIEDIQTKKEVENFTDNIWCDGYFFDNLNHTDEQLFEKHSFILENVYEFFEINKYCQIENLIKNDFDTFRQEKIDILKNFDDDDWDNYASFSGDDQAQENRYFIYEILARNLIPKMDKFINNYTETCESKFMAKKLEKELDTKQKQKKKIKI